MDSKKILLIIPAYNEEKNILNVYHSCSKRKDIDVIVINDGSSDGTLQILKDHGIPYINMIQNVGIGGAVQTGYKFAYENNYDIAIQFDGDGQHNVEFVTNLVEPIINQEADFVIGSRFVDKKKAGFQSSGTRRVGIRIISMLIQCCTGMRITDPTSGFRAANKNVIKEFEKEYPTEYPEPDSVVSLIKKGFLVKEVPVIMNERKEGESSIHSWKSVYYMISVCLAIILTSISVRRKES